MIDERNSRAVDLYKDSKLIQILWNLLAVSLSVTGLVLLAGHNLGNESFWLDESGQFFMSLGLNHFSAIGDPIGSLFQAVRSSYEFNLDPPGFTLLLRAWIGKFGADPATLRALPFLAYVFCFGMSEIIAKRIFKLPSMVGLFIALICLSTYIPLQYSSELRAYSLEMLGVLCTFTLALIFSLKSNWRAAVALSVCLVFFTLFTRYSFILAVFATCVLVTTQLILKRGPTVIRPALLVLVTSGLVALFVLTSVKYLGPSHGEVPEYIQENKLTFSNMKSALNANLIDGRQVGTGLFLLCVFICLVLCVNKRMRGEIYPRIIGKRIIDTWIYIVAYETIAIALSIFGINTWNSGLRWSIGLYAINVVSIIALIFLAIRLFRFLKKRTQTMSSKLKIQGNRIVTNAKSVSLIALIGIAGLTMINAITVMNEFRHNDYQSIKASISAITLNGDFRNQWFVQKGLWPTFHMFTLNGNAPIFANKTSIEAHIIGDYAKNSDELDASIAANLGNFPLCDGKTRSLFLIESTPATKMETVSALRLYAKEHMCKVNLVVPNDTRSFIVEMTSAA